MPSRGTSLTISASKVEGDTLTISFLPHIFISPVSSADSVPGRYVRIRITRHSALVDATGGYLSQIGEIEVYGKDAPPKDGTDTEPDTDPDPDTTPDTTPDTDPDEKPTEAPTEGQDTAAPTEENPTETPTEAPKKGCGSALWSGTVIALLTALAAAWVLRRRKGIV